VTANRSRPFLIAALLGATVSLSACSRQSEDDGSEQAAADVELPELRSRADSIAMNVRQAVGGPRAWASLRYLRFDFGVDDGERHSVYRKHLWDRTSGKYRIEWTGGEDSSWVVLMNVRTRDGFAYLNGGEVSGADKDSLVQRAFRSYVNDTYWLLAPVKLLDPGVERIYLPGWSDEETDVITAMYRSPNLAPDDQFWFWIDRNSSKLVRWAYVRNGEPDAGPIVYEWGDYESFPTEAGTLKFIPRKSGPGADLLTDNISIPASIREDAFESPLPQL
jgi:hypothetical protein